MWGLPGTEAEPGRPGRGSRAFTDRREAASWGHSVLEAVRTLPAGRWNYVLGRGTARRGPGAALRYGQSFMCAAPLPAFPLPELRAGQPDGSTRSLNPERRCGTPAGQGALHGAAAGTGEEAASSAGPILNGSRR